MNRLNKTEFAVFLYCRFSLFLKDPFFPDYLDMRCNVIKITITVMAVLVVLAWDMVTIGISTPYR